MALWQLDSVGIFKSSHLGKTDICEINDSQSNASVGLIEFQICGAELKVTDAATRTFRHEGRIPDIRCGCETP